jgi:hypothetical protein
LLNMRKVFETEPLIQSKFGIGSNMYHPPMSTPK